MKRIQYHRYGGPEELCLEEVAVTVPLTDAIAALVELGVYHQPEGKLPVEPTGGAAS